MFAVAAHTCGFGTIEGGAGGGGSCAGRRVLVLAWGLHILRGRLGLS